MSGPERQPSRISYYHPNGSPSLIFSGHLQMYVHKRQVYHTVADVQSYANEEDHLLVEAGVALK